MMNKVQGKYRAFIESICSKYGCKDAISPLQEGFAALCESIYQGNAPVGGDPADYNEPSDEELCCSHCGWPADGELKKYDGRLLCPDCLKEFRRIDANRDPDGTMYNKYTIIRRRSDGFFPECRVPGPKCESMEDDYDPQEYEDVNWMIDEGMVGELGQGPEMEPVEYCSHCKKELDSSSPYTKSGLCPECYQELERMARELGGPALMAWKNMIDINRKGGNL